ncbi:MBL fold metallo-hydrolase [Chloroflexota bacterium]
MGKTVREVARGVYQLSVQSPDGRLFRINSYLLQGTQGYVLIDTCWNTEINLENLIAALKTLGSKLTDIAKIVITHVHADHFGMAGKIKQLSPQTRIYTQRKEAEFIESRYIRFDELQHKMAVLLQGHGVPESESNILGTASMPILQYVAVNMPDHVFDGGEVITNGFFNLEVVLTPGHSPGHICLYEPEKQLLFSGDHVLPSITPNIPFHVQSGSNPLKDYFKALRKVEILPVSQVLPAHGKVFTNLKERIAEITESHHQRLEEILEIIGNEKYMAFDIAAKVKWNIGDQSWDKLPPNHRRAAVLETLAHLNYLEKGGKICKKTKDNKTLFSLA